MTHPKLSRATVFIDGASRGNPGPAAVGIVFQDGAGNALKNISVAIGLATNNVAEYCALVFAMQEALFMRVGELKVFTDSELLTRQFSGEYKVKEPTLRVLFLIVSHLKHGFKSVTVTHVPRERNTFADREANRALDQNSFFL